MCRFRPMVALAVFVVGLVATPTFAGVVVYTDQASFLAATAPGSYLETFDSLATGVGPASIGFSDLGFSYTAVASFDFSFPFTIPLGDPNDVILGTNFSDASITFSFTSGNVTAVGGYFFTTDFFGTPVATDLLVSTDQTLAQTLSPTLGALTFLGFTSDIPFISLTITSTDPGNDIFLVANDLIVGAAVPEPSTLALAGTGGVFGLVIGWRRYRRARPIK